MEDQLKKYRNIFEQELFSILDYWTKYSVQEDGFGFYGAVDLDNKPVPGANKSCVLNSRILWTFSEAAKVYPGKNYSEIAHLAYTVIRKYFRDFENGGYYMELQFVGDHPPRIQDTGQQDLIRPVADIGQIRTQYTALTHH